MRVLLIALLAAISYAQTGWTEVGPGCCLDNNGNEFSWKWGNGDVDTVKGLCEADSDCVGIGHGEWGAYGGIILFPASRKEGKQLEHSDIGDGNVISSDSTCHVNGKCHAISRSPTPEASPCGNKGTFMTNEGQTITMEPYAIRDFYVFGMKERQYFKMSSVDAEGNWIENRYSRLEMTPTMTDAQREQIWDTRSYISFDYGYPVGYSIHDVSIGCTPFKRKVVKELLERVEEAVRKTKTIVRKKVQQIQNSFNEPGSNYNSDEIGMIEQIANRIDDNEVAGFRMMMDAIDHLKYHYWDNGESKNRHNDDKIRKRWVKKLFRVIGDKHMIQFKAYLNRKMNEIEKNENLLYATLSNSVEGLAALTARRGSTAHEWLVHAEQQRYELSTMYDRNGNPKSP